MEREDRLSRLVDLILESGSVRVEGVMEHFGVSPATARRDLDVLAEQQLVTRTRGGAMSNSSSGDLPLRYRSVRNGHAKRAIASRVAELVEPGSVIAFNGGTTTTAAAYEVGVRSASDPLFAAEDTTLVTNAVNIANDLTVRPQLRIVVIGGVARTRSYELIGPLTSLILPEISIDTLFLGVNAIDPARGLFAQDDGEAAVNAALIAAARRTVVVADASKFAATAFARIVDFTDADAVLTDAGITDTDADAVREAGVELLLA
ncbi:DeoR/GlpR family DNA-binding transcription regulator [Microbacterium suaedae]|uniref:DeoR/GlpR family DNA-binding transcription regulator n=1 Tax=Microbacterium suaedae TaxID=2067813 RepID=UPI000DA252B1|nr:DeoR/GlpR family DNA-binding transcription regulator [Microbacterium suaedae]